MIRSTTLVRSARLDRTLGAEVILASETFQHTGSFKFRGAWHTVSNVPNEHLLAPIAREGLGLMAGLFWDLGDPAMPRPAHK